MTKLGQKSIDCLLLAEINSNPTVTKADRDEKFKEWKAFYDEISAKYSEKAVCRKMEDLSEMGYIEYGVSARTGWLEEKGRIALEEYRNGIK